MWITILSGTERNKNIISKIQVLSISGALCPCHSKKDTPSMLHENVRTTIMFSNNSQDMCSLNLNTKGTIQTLKEYVVTKSILPLPYCFNISIKCTFFHGFHFRFHCYQQMISYFIKYIFYMFEVKVYIFASTCNGMFHYVFVSIYLST